MLWKGIFNVLDMNRVNVGFVIELQKLFHTIILRCTGFLTDIQNSLSVKRY